MSLLSKSFAALAVTVFASSPAQAQQKVDEFGFAIAPRPATPFDSLFTSRQLERLGISINKSGYTVTVPSNNPMRSFETINFFCPFSFLQKDGQVMMFDDVYDQRGLLRVTTTDEIIEAVTVDTSSGPTVGTMMRVHTLARNRITSGVCHLSLDQKSLEDCVEASPILSVQTMRTHSASALKVCRAAHAFLPLRPGSEAASVPLAGLKP